MGKTSQKQIKYMDDYRKKYIRYISVRLRLVEDKKIIDWLDSKTSKTSYIKNLILKDMKEKEKSQ